MKLFQASKKFYGRLTSFFQSFKKQPIHSGASCLSRCLIYKVHTALCGGLLSYHIVFSLSRTFFKFFQTFFVLSFRLHAPWRCLADSSIRLPHSVSFVKHFFQVFLNFQVLFVCLLYTSAKKTQALFSPYRLLNSKYYTQICTLVKYHFQRNPAIFQW